MVRETGNSYYDYSQVENTSADGVYSNNETTKKYFSESINVNCNGWIGLNGIMPSRLTEQKMMPNLAQLLGHTYLLQ